jgi:hypothetical protein
MVMAIEQDGISKGTRMALRERYIKERNGTGQTGALDEVLYGNQAFQEMKARLHRAIISRMDLVKLNNLPADRIAAKCHDSRGSPGRRKTHHSRLSSANDW